MVHVRVSDRAQVGHVALVLDRGPLQGSVHLVVDDKAGKKYHSATDPCGFARDNDRDEAFAALAATVGGLDIEDLRTAPRSPP